MALPKINAPKYTLTVPSTGKEYQYRPFLVKEEKILLMALEGGEMKDVIVALKQVIENCFEGQLDMDSLATFDIEYIFTQLRSKSIGSIIELKSKMKCDQEGCPKSIPFEINLDEIELVEDENHTKDIKLTKVDGIVMKYPSFETLTKLQGTNDVDALYEAIVNSIDYIYDAENTYDAKSVKKEELHEYISTLTHAQFEKVSKFFETMPKIQKKVNITCPKCGKTEELVVTGLDNFFG